MVHSFDPTVVTKPTTDLDIFLRGITDADQPRQTLTFSLVGAPAGASIDPVTGQFTWTPTQSQAGQFYDFQVRVSDNGFPVKFDQRFVFVVVQGTAGSGPATNSAPVLTVPFLTNGTRGSTIRFTATATDADVPKQRLTFSLVGAPAGASIDPVMGKFTWTPTQQASFEWEFRVRVTDNGQPALSMEKWTYVYIHAAGPTFKGDADTGTNASLSPMIDHTIQAFLDLNGNGLQDAGEPSLPGRTVYLDYDNNGELGADEPRWITGDDGTVMLDEIPQGPLTIRFVLLPGETASTPTVYHVDGDWNGTEVTLGILPDNSNVGMPPQQNLLPDGTRGTPDQLFVAALYRDLLHRSVDPEGCRRGPVRSPAAWRVVKLSWPSRRIQGKRFPARSSRLVRHVPWSGAAGRRQPWTVCRPPGQWHAPGTSGGAVCRQ